MRIAEAGALLGNQHWDGAYYLAGYAVECGLKACISKQVNQYDFPDKQFAIDCYSHDLEKLLSLAGLKGRRSADAALDPILETNWQIVRQWAESSRYARFSQSESQLLYDAITDNSHGVLPWIKLHCGK